MSRTAAKWTLVIAAFGLLVVLAGCTGGSVDQAALQKNATYEWNTSAAVTVNATGSQYHMVYTVDNRSEIHLSMQDQFGGVTPIPISAVKFRYPNGTVVGADALTVTEQNKETVVQFPAKNGTFAFTASAGSRSLTVPVLTNRSHEVILPPGMRVSLPVVGGVSPGGYRRSVEGNRVHLRWSSVSGDAIRIDYYLERDVLLFGGLIAALVVVAAIGVAYYRSLIGRLEDQRERAGLDVDEDEDESED